MSSKTSGVPEAHHPGLRQEQKLFDDAWKQQGTVDLERSGLNVGFSDSVSDAESSGSESTRGAVGKAVQNFFWAEMKHKVVKKTRHLALATRTLVQAHGPPTASAASAGKGKLNTKFDKRVAGKLQRLESQLSRQTRETSLIKEHAKLKLLETSAPMRAELMEKLRELMKQRMTMDRDMWNCVKSFLYSMVDSVWEDVEKEIELNVELAWLKSDRATKQNGPVTSWRCYDWLRRKVLRHYLPYDRSIFGKLKNPLYLALTLTMLVPNAGFRVSVLSVILGFILVPGPPDEFQLINFILLSKGTQFITGGLVSMGQGAAIYFGCFNWSEDHLTDCIANRGPGKVSSLTGELADYLGSVLLVWVAFLALPFAQEHRQQKRESTRRNNAAESCESPKRKFGGRLANLLRYDVGCFMLSLLVLFTLTAGNLENRETEVHASAYRHFQENIFWCKVLYSLLSMPFSLFTIQPLQQVLTHTAPTGFNEFGACV
eukprot:CAMPEP_0181413868 /NCGR_PEP_ID=MMETSP1110-20121109/9202_1 /TAXON_ID=174948 /ORGANISM="Symbiodinium sp., Strain CCMP421" /LENGTH=486 /DNA_ID=CAMNT_0023536711 /DNA_START=21 /DNA_END=1478 /DNA_ORIENTATION=+